MSDYGNWTRATRWCALAAIALGFLIVPRHLTAQTTPGTGVPIPTYPGYHTLLINELQTSNATTLSNSLSHTTPWIELYNPGDQIVFLDNYALSDNFYKFRQWRFPAKRVLFPKQYLIVWMDGEASSANTGEIHSTVRLKPEGGSLVLTTLQSGRPLIVDYLDYPPLIEDVSYGLIPTTTQNVGIRKVFTHPTPGAANRNLPSLVINEWFISPANEPGWFELYNPGRESVDLNGLVVTLFGTTAQVAPYVIPKGFIVPAGGFMRVWADGTTLFPPTFDPRALHLPWKLPTQPFTLSINLADGSPLSQAVTRALDPKRAEARYPDGGKSVYSVNLATPAAPNVGPPRWVTEPRSLRVREGSNVVWRVNATGSAPLTYRWFRGEVEFPNNNSPELKLGTVTPRDEGTYRILVTNPAGALTASVNLTVIQIPRIVVNTPLEIPISLGKTLDLPSLISGTGPYQFQWKRNGVNIPSARKQNYTKDQIDLNDGGSYTAVILNEAGATLSIPVRVLVDAPVLKGGDDLADRSAIESQSLFGTFRSSTVNTTREAGEPAHAGNKGGHSVWFSWVPPTSGVVTLNTRGSTFDTLLAVYTGRSISTLQKIESDDDSGGYYTSELRFNASSKTNYLIAVDGFGGDSGDFLLSWRLDLESPPIPVILRHPGSLTQIPGKAATFSVTAVGNALRYQWFFNGSSITGATKDTLTLDGVTGADIGQYWVVITSGDKTSVTSRVARLELGDANYPPSEDKYEPPTRAFSFPGLGDPALADTPIAVGIGSIGSRSLSLLGSATSASEPPPCGEFGGSSRYVGFALSANTDLIVDTIGSSEETVLSVYSLGASAIFNYEGCSHDGSNSLVTIHGVAGTTYYAFIDTPSGDSAGTSVINWRVGTPPVLVSPSPAGNTNIDFGSALTLPISVSSQPTLAGFQWRVDGDPIGGGSAQQLNIFGASPDDSGTYSIILSNAMGSVTGDVAHVHVNVPLKLNVTEIAGDKGKDIRIQGAGEQGFWIEASTDLVNWCAFAVNPVPLNPFDYVFKTPESHTQLFFRCTAWPAPDKEAPVDCGGKLP